MDRIIHLHRDPHRETEQLLPWYVTGQLDPVDHASVETHLAACAACRAELRMERRLSTEVADLQLDVSPGWSALRARLDRPVGRPERSSRQPRMPWRLQLPSVNIRWVLAAQAALVAIIVPLAMRRENPAPFHTLGSPQTAIVGNIVVIFRPDARERDLRRTLNASSARLIDGPTAADAYVVLVPAAQRDAALVRLRAQPDVVLAQPIDAGPPS